MTAYRRPHPARMIAAVGVARFSLVLSSGLDAVHWAMSVVQLVARAVAMGWCWHRGRASWHRPGAGP